MNNKIKRSTHLTMFLVTLIFSSVLSSGELPRPNHFGGNFSLDSTLNKTASLNDWKGKVVLLNFGFTSCPDVCPMVLSKLTLVQNQLDKDAKKVQVIFVSVDPDRDSIEKITNYLKFYHASFVGMRGNESNVGKVLKRYGASVHIDKKDSSSEVSHTDYVYVIDQQGYVAGFYDVKDSYQTLVDAVKKLL